MNRTLLDTLWPIGFGLVDTLIAEAKREDN
jgi:hypothetical protein